MISPKFYSQISTCSGCRGWGTVEFPPTKYNELCRECNGRGVTVNQSESTYFWGAPTFIDYKNRAFTQILKIMVPVIIFVFMFILILILRLALLRLVAK